MPTARDQEQYLMEMLDKTNPSHVTFIEEFRAKMGGVAVVEIIKQLTINQIIIEEDLGKMQLWRD